MDFTVRMQLFGLVAARLSPLFLGSVASPFRNIPLMIRLLLVVIFSIIILLMNESQLVMPDNFIIAMIKELFIGFLFVLPLMMAMAAILTMGRVVDMQIGFGAAGVVSPSTQGQEPLIGSIYLLGFTTLFFLLGMHAELLALLNASYQAIPIGQYALAIDMPNILSLVFTNFTLGLLLFSPVMLVIWCVDVLVGFVSKTMPQMNIYFVTLPLKIFIGLIVAGVTLKFSAQVFKLFFSSTLSFIHQLGG